MRISFRQFFPLEECTREIPSRANSPPSIRFFLRATVSSCYKKILFYSAGDKLSPIQIAYPRMNLHAYANTYTKTHTIIRTEKHASYNRSLAHSYTQKHMPLSNKISLIIHALAQNMLNARRRCVETLQEIYVCVCVFVYEYYCIYIIYIRKNGGRSRQSNIHIYMYRSSRSVERKRAFLTGKNAKSKEIQRLQKFPRENKDKRHLRHYTVYKKTDLLLCSFE